MLVLSWLISKRICDIFLLKTNNNLNGFNLICIDYCEYSAYINTLEQCYKIVYKCYESI